MVRLFVPTFMLLLGLFLSPESLGQTTDSKEAAPLVQFSGVVVAAEDLQPIPYTSVIIKNTRYGTIADNLGYFSFVAQNGDTIQFSSVGFKTVQFIIPDTLVDSRYSLIQVMQSDTVNLPETVIYPWPTKEEFKEAFLALELPHDDLDRAYFNLDRERIAALGGQLSMNGTENFRYQMQQHQSRLYTAGQAPQNNLLNPLAWAKFIQSWRNGELKRQ